MSAETFSGNSATTRYALPIVAASLLIVCVAGWLAFEIPRGAIVQADELRTAERSREMLLKGPWTVHLNFVPSFAKPPLQYWLTTWSLARFGNPSVALRVWPLLYATLTALALGWLSFLIDPKRPWLISLALAIFVSSPLFLTEARCGLLDMGLTFFTTLAIVFAQLARTRPAWWLGVAVACWLGTLQKLPLIFFIWLIIVLVRVNSATERAVLRSGWFKASVILAIALTLIWPSIQFVKYQMPPTRAFTGDEFADLLVPQRSGAQPYFDIAWMVVGFLLLAGAAFLFSKRQTLRASVLEISMVALIITGLALIPTLIFNFRSIRYFLPILPCYSILLALLLHHVFARKGKVRAGALIFLVLLVSSGFVQGKMRINHLLRDKFDQQRVAQRLGVWQSEGMPMLLIESSDLLPDSFYLFYGNLRFPLQKRALEQLREAPIKPPVVGICTTSDFPVLQEIYPQARVELASGELICWRATTSF